MRIIIEKRREAKEPGARMNLRISADAPILRYRQVDLIQEY